ncbi:MAG: branched-chain amino acid aminotransferase [Bacteroidetes bacterium]|nr:branched-chain amino acid aminotransferase [Bacteroidota bacterium]
MEMTLDIAVERTPTSRIGQVDFDNIQFGRIFSDHQYLVDFDGENWVNPRVVPYGKIAMSPAISAIHYGQAIFEGMKAYKDTEGNPQLFRPLENWKRLNRSAHRMGMQEIPEEFFMEGIRALLDIDKDWIPTTEGSSLYLRPFMFATDDYIGVRPSNTYTFAIFSCPVNAYYSQPLRVKAESHYIRAAEGGVGAAKCAGNYGSVMMPAKLAQKEGFHQVLWLDAREHKFIEETGTTNMFVRIGDTLLTPSLDRHTILAGITRDSILKLAAHWGWKIEERDVNIDEVFEAYRNGTLKEIFASGTAATVAQVELIHYEGEEIQLGGLDSWEWYHKLSNTMREIKTGKTEDIFNWIYKL